MSLSSMVGVFLRAKVALYEYNQIKSLSPLSKRFDDCHLDIRTLSPTTSKTLGSRPKDLRITDQSSPIGSVKTPVASSPPSGPISA